MPTAGKVGATDGTTRPTGAKVREAVFNYGPLPPSPVLDLFAGTGALGIEALSRGASRATFVERDHRALASLQRNLRLVEMSGRSRVMDSSVELAIHTIFVGKGREVLLGVRRSSLCGGRGRVSSRPALGWGLLDNGAVVVVEHDRHSIPPDKVGVLDMVDRRYYGDTGISFYRRQRELD